MNEIEIQQVSKTYNPGLFKKKVRAVDGLDLAIRSGEVFGLVGPNGAGKSTTIRLLLNLIRPDSGQIVFRGNPVEGTFLQKEVGYLSENPYLYDHLTVTELLVFCGRTSGLAAAQIQQRSHELLSKMGLLEAQKRPLRTFSKGMLQRAGICFALLHDPSLIVFDEPMSGLDPIGRKMVFDLVTELRQQGKTIFFCSHILNDVERLCDRIGLMIDGRLVEEVSPGDLLQFVDGGIVLRIEHLDDRQLRDLLALGCEVRSDGQETLLLFAGDKNFSCSSYLEAEGIRILGCRSEWLSLEDLFVRKVREQNR